MNLNFNYLPLFIDIDLDKQKWFKSNKEILLFSIRSLYGIFKKGSPIKVYLRKSDNKD